MLALAAGGFRAVAPDLRGYGASDKPPRGYDSLTLAADVTGLIRALGERDAILVGHGWGGHLAWTAASVAPTAVRKLAVVSSPHPLAWAGALARSRPQRAAVAHVARFQLPWHPERWLVADGGANVAALLHRAGGPGYPDDETEQRARDAMAILAAPHCALEYFRWVVRSVPRADGRRFRRLLRQPVTAPTLQLHGALDDYVLPATAQNSARRVSAAYEWRLLGGV